MRCCYALLMSDVRYVALKRTATLREWEVQRSRTRARSSCSGARWGPPAAPSSAELRWVSGRRMTSYLSLSRCSAACLVPAVDVEAEKTQEGKCWRLIAARAAVPVGTQSWSACVSFAPAPAAAAAASPWAESLARPERRCAARPASCMLGDAGGGGAQLETRWDSEARALVEKTDEHRSGAVRKSAFVASQLDWPAIQTEYR